jgi:hypothetical protein
MEGKIETNQIQQNRNRVGDDRTEMNECESRQLPRRRITLINNSKKIDNE